MCIRDSNSCPFALQKDPFCSPKGLVLQPKRTPFQNGRTFNFRKRRFSEMVMLVPFYPVSLHHQKKTNNIQRRIKQKTKEKSNRKQRWKEEQNLCCMKHDYRHKNFKIYYNQGLQRTRLLDILTLIIQTTMKNTEMAVALAAATCTNVQQIMVADTVFLSLIHIWRCRRIERCRSRWSPYH